MTEEFDLRGFLETAVTDAAEPPHRNLAESSIVRGDATRRRNRVLGSAGGMTLGAVAVVGAFGLTGQGAPPQKVAAGPPPVVDLTFGDKIRDVHARLPGLLQDFLPRGVSIGLETNPGIPYKEAGVEMGFGFHLSGVAMKDPAMGGDTFYATGGKIGWQPAEDRARACGAAPGEECTDVRTVPNGRLYTVADREAGPSGGPDLGYAVRYEFIPTDRSRPYFMMALAGVADPDAFTAQQFQAMVEAPGFDKVTTLLDPATPPSAAAVKQRGQIDEQVAKTVRGLLPQGLSLRVSVLPELASELSLFGPKGPVGFSWQETGMQSAGVDPMKCAAAKDWECHVVKVPGGRVLESYGTTGWQGRMGTGMRTLVYTPDDPKGTQVHVEMDGVDTESVLTVDQFLAIAKTPGIAGIIDTVKSEVNK